MKQKTVVRRFIAAKGHSQILCLTLNKPKALNALDLNMVIMLTNYLQQAKNDDSVSAVFIDGAGERAFCAGGDIVRLYNELCQESVNKVTDATNIPASVADFFMQEYQLDYLIHTYPKPIIVWGNGVVMGGGLGLFRGASIRIATETTRIAMPEISIGLFPDVGASYFLNELPAGVGVFLGFTGAEINALDAIALNLATHLLANSDKAVFLSFLVQVNVNDRHAFHQSLDAFISKVSNAERTSLFAPAALLPFLDHVSVLDKAINAEAAANELLALGQLNQSDYINRALKSFQYGSSTTAHLVFQQLLRARRDKMSLADCFKMELSMAYSCMAVGEFKEGVRALLVDKDKTPKWRYQQLAKVPHAFINAHFDYFKNYDLPLNPLDKMSL